MRPRDRILEPYTRRVNDIPHRLRKTLAVAGVMFLAVIIGFLTAVLPVQFVVIPILPLGALALLVLWMAPDIDPELDRPLRILFVIYMAFALTWPHYIAFVLPGIGYVTPTRLVLLLICPLALWFFATSARARGTIAAGLNAGPFAKWAFIAMVTLHALIAAATNTFSSFWFIAQFNFHLMFIIAIFAFSYQGVLRQVLMAIVAGIFVVNISTALEYMYEYKFWMDWVPPFLRGDPELWNKVYAFGARAGTDQYRGSGTLLTSVTVGEFIAITAPFVVFLAADRTSRWSRLLVIPVVIAITAGTIAAGSRTAFAGMLAGLGLYATLWTARRYIRSRRTNELLGPAAVWAYPVVGLLTVLAVLFVGRVRRLVLGGGEHQNSDNAREEQWRRTFDLAERNPFGYGHQRAGELIGFKNPGRDNYTVDGYYMSLLVDQGVIGFLLFILFFAGCAWVAGRMYLRASTPEEEAGAAIAASLLAYLVAKAVLSQMENMYFAFAIAGAALALAARQNARIRAEGAASMAPTLRSVLSPPPRIPRPVRPVFGRLPQA